MATATKKRKPKKPATQYKAADGAQYNDAKAVEIGYEIERKIGGTVTPETLLAIARNESSPLYDLFEWDVRKAAKAHWLSQARNILNHLLAYDAATKQWVRAFHCVQVVRLDADENEVRSREYLHIDVVKASPAAARSVVDFALAELEGWRSRYQAYRDVFGEVFEVADKVAKRVKKSKS